MEAEGEKRLGEKRLTGLWVENLRGQVRGRRAWREVFIAVGDEGSERVHVVSVLHHWDFVGLLRETCTNK